jgi:hypothetical protein
VLARAAILGAASQPFQAQAGPERRVWLCVSTRTGTDVCTAQLAAGNGAEAAVNAPQCAELRAILAHYAQARPVIFGGDLNRRSSCAPPGFWTRTDISAHQDPGSQQAYGTAAFGSPSAKIVPAVHTDHDILLVRAHLSTAGDLTPLSPPGRDRPAAWGVTGRRQPRSEPGVQWATDALDEVRTNYRSAALCGCRHRADHCYSFGERNDVEIAAPSLLISGLFMID